MSELALKLIRENIEKHRRGEDARFLDLGNCGMTEVPEEIGECVWVEELVLSNGIMDWNEQDWSHKESKNAGNPNNLVQLPKSFSLLKNIKNLWLNGNHNLRYELSNIEPLKNLKKLRKLYLHDTGILRWCGLSGQ